VLAPCKISNRTECARTQHTFVGEVLERKKLIIFGKLQHLTFAKINISQNHKNVLYNRVVEQASCYLILTFQ
jgi:hypothetical protein